MRVFIALWFFFLGSLHAAQIHVLAAASLNDSLKELAAAYEKSAGHKILLNFGASNFLARQVEAGAPADIFFSADQAQMDRLAAKSLLLSETRRNLLSNSLVIVILGDSSFQISSAKDLLHSQIKRLALADPAAVPAGIYAKQYLQKMSLWDELQPRIIPTDNVRAALASVEAGNCEAAIIYKTDAAISKKTKVAFQVPRESTPDITYPLAVLRDSKQPAAARAFCDYLASTNSLRIFQKHGFITTAPNQR